MKSRLFCLIVACLLSVVAVAQNTNVTEPTIVSASVTTPAPGLHLFDNAALPSDQRFALPPNATGDSSSRKHSTVKADDGTTGSSSRASQGPCEQLPAKPWFSSRTGMNSAPAQLKAGKRICGLNAGQKFALFAKSTVSPLTFLGAGASAGISQYNNDDAEWGQGAEAYGKRYAAAYTDRAAYAFFGKFFYPTIFRQDPRYFRAREDASTGQRFGHAFAHTFVTRTDAGRNMPNVSLWASAASTAALRNLYHPGNDRGFASAARTTGIYLGTSMGWDVLKEFWPGVSRTLHLPFQAR